jgi:Methyltransferase domain
MPEVEHGNGPIRRAARFVLQRLGVRSLLALRRSGALVQDGWFRSFDEGRPVDADGQPLPWLTYGSIEFLSSRVRGDMSVFEYGSGWGTLWWAARVSRVVACEHDPKWHHEMARQVPSKVTLIHEPLHGGAYARTASRWPGTFDIIVIDGRDRVRCALHSVAALKPSGVFVWDNTDRYRYAEGLSALAERGFRRIDFVGLVPGSIVKAQTSILYRAENVLGI